MNGGGHRIFIAVPLDHALARAVETAERQLEAAGVVLKWIAPDNLHLTLRFLGEISPPQLTRARRAARAAVEGVEAFQIRITGIGAFPTVRRPRVVWVGVAEGAEKLVDLAHRLDDALARERFPKESRAFHPHLTLARIKGAGRSPALEAAIGPLGALEVGRQWVKSLVVLESHLRPSGALYIPVEEVPLSTHEK